MRRLIRKVFLLSLYVCSYAALADEQLPNKAVIFHRDGYDYGPSMIASDTVENFWWCGSGNVPGVSPYTDVIYHRQYDRNSGVWGDVSVAIQPEAGKWDGVFTCDPAVVQGDFVNPDDGAHYGYALYYTGTNSTTGTNSVGVAFSNDEINWTKFSGNPIVVPQLNGSTYGAGQPAVYNQDGQAGILMVHTDTSTTFGDRLWERVSTDGIHFGQPILLSNIASDGTVLCTNADIAYDYSGDVFYSVIANCAFQRVGEQDKFQFGLYRMPGSSFRDGSGQWESLASVNSALTGFELNHSPGFRRNGYGDITPWLPSVAMYFAGGSADPATWDISLVTWSPGPSTLPLKRYARYPNGHWVTTGYVDAGYQLEQTLGYIYMAMSPGTVALYACTTSSGYHLLTRDAECEEQHPEGVIGWLYSSAGTPDTQAVYRCATITGDHFVSTDPACEGAITENLGLPLGWVSQIP